VAGVLTHERLVEWIRATYGWRHVESRISDLGYAFVVDTQPDEYHDGDRSAMTYGNGPMTVVKRTGGVWEFGSNPAFWGLYAARTEEEFRRELRKLLPRADRNRAPRTIAFG
jgi:hypothetical protein